MTVIEFTPSSIASKTEESPARFACECGHMKFCLYDDGSVWYGKCFVEIDNLLVFEPEEEG